MKNKSAIDYPYKALLWTIGGLMLVLAVIEGWRFTLKPEPQELDVAIEKSLDEAVSAFNNQQRLLLDISDRLGDILQEKIRQGHSRQSLYSSLQEHPELWGAALLKNGEAYVWSGFAIEQLAPVDSILATSDNVQLELRKQNNVIFWMSDSRFAIQADSASQGNYRLILSSRIAQENALPIGKSSEFNLFTHGTESSSYPINYSFFNPVTTSIDSYKVLRNNRQDSVGMVYARSNQYYNPLESWQNGNWFWRSLFIVFCFVSLSLVFGFWFESLPETQGMIYQLLMIAVGWGIFRFLDIPGRWLPLIIEEGSINSGLLQTFEVLSSFAVDSFFLFLTAFTLSRKLKEIDFPVNSNWFLSTIFIGLATGALNTSAILFTLNKSYRAAVTSGVELMDLNVFPAASTLLYSVFLGVILCSLFIFLVSVNRFVIRSANDKQKMLSAVIILGFMLLLLISQLFIPESIRLNWALWLSMVIFGLAFSVTITYLNYTRLVRELSALRLIAIGGLALSIIATPIVFHVYGEKQDNRLREIAEDFSLNNYESAERLTTRILTQLEQKMRGLSSSQLENRVSFIQSEFTQTIQSLVQNNRQNYSIDLHMIRPDGSVISDYSTNLNSPGWVNTYDMQRLSAAVRIERITKATNRPIVQRPQLQDEENYISFYRGWIPIFGENEATPIAWILCSVYKEKPDFDKPIRAVMASLTYEDWNNSHQVMEYQDRKLIRSVQQGVTGYFPQYHRIGNAETEALQEDSLLYYNTANNQHSYRNMLWRVNDNTVVKATTIKPDYKNILFSFFRLNFIFMITGSICALVVRLSGLKEFRFLGNSNRFRHRILDNFLFATLLFLILLVIATHYAIKNQNQDIVQQELLEKLESLSRTTEVNPVFQSTNNINAASLDSIVSPLNVDASFYADKKVSESTTPQIYQQHLLPTSLPFPIFNQLFDEHRRDAMDSFTLASQQLLVGYRSVLSQSDDPVAVVAIPTFVQSPKYDQQLLETTSYLIILYLIVFGFFIVGTALISNQLTRPLTHIQEGLNKISEGKLDTTIPVSRKDEIGNLARAYNEMVVRLKELQEELAIAEREAAWKEMAQQVAHEIKNPLTPMKLNIQHLERQIQSDKYDPKELKERIQQITGNIIKQIQSLNNIASDFSKFAKPIESEFEDLSLIELLDSVSDLYDHDESISIRKEFPDRSLTIHGASDELRRVVINLLKNAFEAMPEGGTIKLRTFVQNGSAFIEVEDDGMGISEEDKPKIFVPNFSTKSSGTGLGLAISKKIIEEHKGTISFASIEGKGTTFIIKLPLNNN